MFGHGSMAGWRIVAKPFLPYGLREEEKSEHKSVKQQAIPKALYLAMLCQFAVGGAVIPFAGLFLRERGLSYVEASHVFALSSSMLLVFPFLWGMVADRLIPIDRLFSVLNVLALGAMAFLYQQWSYTGLLIGFLMFYSCYHPTFTLINALCFHHLSSPEQQFGKVRAWGSIGWIVPSLPIYFWLVWRPDAELGFILFVSMVAAVAMTVVTFVLPRTAVAQPIAEPDAEHGPSHRSHKSHYWEDIRLLMRNGNYVAILIAFFLISGSFSLLTYYSPPYMASLGMPRQWIGPIQCIGVVMEIMVFPFLRILLVRWGYRRCLVFGALCLVIRHLLFAHSSTLWLLSMSYVFAGLLIVFFHIGSSIMVNELATHRVRASAQTLLVLAGSGLGPLVTNGVVGLLVGDDDAALYRVFWFAAILALLAAMVIFSRGDRFDSFRSKV